MESEKIQMTREGYNELKKEYDDLVHITRPEVIQELAAARAQGDLSENADYDAARDRQAKVEARIQELDAMLQNAEIVSISKKGTKTVHMGTTVRIHDLKRDTHDTYTIVGAVESDPLHGKISNTTPVGAALMDHKVGDTVSVNTASPYQITIEKIS